MTRILAPVLIFTAAPALAHSGAHLHPHGSGNWLNVALALGLITVAAIAMVRK